MIDYKSEAEVVRQGMIWMQTIPCNWLKLAVRDGHTDTIGTCTLDNESNIINL